MPTTPATRLDTAELSWLLALRPGPAADLVAAALGVPAASDLTEDELLDRGVARRRREELLPAGEAAVVGDVLTGARSLVSVGTATARAALLAIGRDRVLLLVPAGGDRFEVVALDAAADVGDATAEIAARIGPDAVVMVARPGAGIDTMTGAPDLAAEVRAAVAR